MQTRTRWRPALDGRSRGGPPSLRLRPCAVPRSAGADAEPTSTSAADAVPTDRRSPAAPSAVDGHGGRSLDERPPSPTVPTARPPRRGAPEGWRAAVVVVLAPLALLVALAFVVPDVPGRGLALVVGWVLLALLLDRHGVGGVARSGARPPSRSR